MVDKQPNTASDWKDWEKKQSILTDLDDCPLHRKSPYGITNVSMTQFSVARYYGGMNFNGSLYIYNHTTDELIRKDVLKWRNKELKSKRKKKQQGEIVTAQLL
jgi:hypothetical protein